jgi:hypothetical protein
VAFFFNKNQLPQVVCIAQAMFAPKLEVSIPTIMNGGSQDDESDEPDTVVQPDVLVVCDPANQPGDDGSQTYRRSSMFIAARLNFPANPL